MLFHSVVWEVGFLSGWHLITYCPCPPKVCGSACGGGADGAEVEAAREGGCTGQGDRLLAAAALLQGCSILVQGSCLVGSRAAHGRR